MKKVEITVKNDGEDKTHELREIIENKTYEVFQFTQGGSDLKIHAEGDLEHETDAVLHPHLGQYGVIRLEGRNDIEILGKSENDKTLLYTKAPAVPDDGNPVIWSKQSLRQFFNLSENDGVTIKNIRVEGSNGPGARFEDFGGYSRRWEFEHSFNIKNDKNVLIENCESHGEWGDGIKIEGNCENIHIKNFKVSWNGRQGIAVNSGNNILIDGAEITNSRRGGIDFEPNSDRSFITDSIIRNCNLKTWLLPFPMGGRGTIDGVLIENNTYWTDSPTTMMRGDGENFFRRNVIFRGNTALKSFGSDYGGAYILDFCENILIENEVRPLNKHRRKVIAQLKDCKNVIIRNNDFPYAEYIELINTDPSEVTVYGNKQNLSFMIQKEDGTHDIIPVVEYDVAKYGEPEVPKDPDFKPYMGIDAVEEKPVEEDLEEVPGFPEDDTEDPQEDIEKPEVAKAWYKNKGFWIIGAIALLILIATLTLIL